VATGHTLAQIQTVATNAPMAGNRDLASAVGDHLASAVSDFTTAAFPLSVATALQQATAGHLAVTATASGYATAAMTTDSSDRRLLTTHQGDPDDREKESNT
jgi:hypothetical protein